MKRCSVSLFKEDEPPASFSFGTLTALLDKKIGLFRKFNPVFQYYDEPKPWQFVASINSDYLKQEGENFKAVTSGISFYSKNLAILKCLAEAAERYCNFSFFKRNIVSIGSFKDLKTNALILKTNPYFSDKQLKKKGFEKFKITDNSVFSWSEGFSLVTNKNILVPSQMIYLAYRHLTDEPVVYPGISTGTAGGGSLSAAIVRGICEIVERDAFMIFYLNKLNATRILLEKISNKKVQKLLKIMKRYKLNIYSFDITTDIPIPTVLTIITDDTGIGKAVSSGLKSSLDMIDAITGSVEEVFNTRTWLRRDYEEEDPEDIKSGLAKFDVEFRGFLWYKIDVISQLDFLLKSTNSKKTVIQNKVPKKSGQQLKYLVELFKKSGYDVIYKDITLPDFKKINYFVSKVIIPQMQPFFLNEDHRLLGGSRLYSVPKKLGFPSKNEEELNIFPHPFI